MLKSSLLTPPTKNNIICCWSFLLSLTLSRFMHFSRDYRYSQYPFIMRLAAISNFACVHLTLAPVWYDAFQDTCEKNYTQKNLMNSFSVARSNAPLSLIPLCSGKKPHIYFGEIILHIPHIYAPCPDLFIQLH